MQRPSLTFKEQRNTKWGCTREQIIWQKNNWKHKRHKSKKGRKREIRKGYKFQKEKYKITPLTLYLPRVHPTLSSMYSHKLCNRQFVKKRPKSGSKFNFLCSVLISLQLHCCIHVSCFKMTDVSRSEFVMNQNFVGEILYKYMYMHEWNSMTGIERPCPFQSSEELLQVQSKL